jgi:hypothetical protein
MQVKVRHGLAGVISDVRHESPPLIQILVLRDSRREAEQLAQQLAMLRSDLRGGRRYVLFRDEENVRRRLRIDVAKREDSIGLVHSIARNGAGHDLAEQTFRHDRTPYSVRAAAA